jgi:hypothetical protein
VTQESDANMPVSQWTPGLFFRKSVTQQQSVLPADEQDQSWADLAAQARAAWARENPF